MPRLDPRVRRGSYCSARHTCYPPSGWRETPALQRPRAEATVGGELPPLLCHQWWWRSLYRKHWLVVDRVAAFRLFPWPWLLLLLWLLGFFYALLCLDSNPLSTPLSPRMVNADWLKSTKMVSTNQKGLYIFHLWHHWSQVRLLSADWLKQKNKFQPIRSVFSDIYDITEVKSEYDITNRENCFRWGGN